MAGSTPATFRREPTARRRCSTRPVHITAPFTRRWSARSPAQARRRRATAETTVPAAQAATPRRRWVTIRSVFALVAASVFLAFVVGAAARGSLPLAVPIVYAAASVTAAIVYAADKSAARRNQWRTRERTLHLLALAGGWPGALVAQTVFRHKTRKMSFRLVFWMTVVLNCGALAWWMSTARS